MPDTDFQILTNEVKLFNIENSKFGARCYLLFDPVPYAYSDNPGVNLNVRINIAEYRC